MKKNQLYITYIINSVEAICFSVEFVCYNLSEDATSLVNKKSKNAGF